MRKRLNEIIDEVYEYYHETHEYESFIMSDEMGLSKEEFIKKVTNNYGFGFLFGINLLKISFSNCSVKNDQFIPSSC